MRTFAQCSLGLIIVFVAMMWKMALLLWLLWPFFIAAAFPIFWYVLFERHLETNNAEIIQQLEMIRNAISDGHTKAQALPLVPR